MLLCTTGCQIVPTQPEVDLEMVIVQMQLFVERKLFRFPFMPLGIIHLDPLSCSSSADYVKALLFIT